MTIVHTGPQYSGPNMILLEANLEAKIKKSRKGMVLIFFLFAVINTITRNKMARKGFMCLTFPG